MRNIRLLESHRDLLREGLKSGGGTVLRQWDDHLPNFWHETLILRIVEYGYDGTHNYWTDPFLLRPGLDRMNLFLHVIIGPSASGWIQIALDDPPTLWGSLRVPGYDQAAGTQQVGLVNLAIGAAAYNVVDLTDWLSGFNFRWCRLLFSFAAEAVDMLNLEVPIDMRGTHI